MSNVFIITYTENDQFNIDSEFREVIAVKRSSQEQLKILAVSGYKHIDSVSGYFLYEVTPETVDSPVENSLAIVEDFFSALGDIYFEEMISLDRYDLANAQRKLDEDFDPLTSPEDLLEIAKASNSWSTLDSNKESFSEPEQRPLSIFDQLQSFLQESQDNETSLVDWLESEYQISLSHSNQPKELDNEEELDEMASRKPSFSFDELDVRMILESSRLKPTKENVELALSEVNFFLKQGQVKNLVSGFFVDLFTTSSVRNIFN